MQAAFNSCTCNCCWATNAYRKCIFMSFIPYANNSQLKAEGDLAALKHWYPYSYIMHDKTLFSTLCFPFYVFALSVLSVLNGHKTEQSTSTFATSNSFWPTSAQSNSYFTWSWHKILSFFSQMVCFVENWLTLHNTDLIMIEIVLKTILDIVDI